MVYLISFLEGVITFISPCLLPLLPVYITFFAGGESDNSKQTLKNAVCFVLGFTLVFTTMGVFAGTIGASLAKYQSALNIATGLVVILLGLSFLGVIKTSLFRGASKSFIATHNATAATSLLFGIVFSVAWTPCVGAFLGSALMLASNQASMIKGAAMLVCFSLGLGIPFVLCAVLIGNLKGLFGFIKRNYKVINTLSGCLLILFGILMMTGIIWKLA